MIVVVINYTGTVGKTTVSVHLLAPRMSGASVFAIETINQAADEHGIAVEKLRGENFRQLFSKLFGGKPAIIDVGASNVEAFMKNLEGFEDAHEEFDYFVVPVTPGVKEQQETVGMISTLLALGIPGDKIRVLFNRVQHDVQSEFNIILEYYDRNPVFWLNPECAIGRTELFDAVSRHGTTIDRLVNDGVDYKKKMAEDITTDERARLGDLFGLKLLAKGTNRKLDRVFNVLFDREAKSHE
jgi:hypothetical protein